MRRKVLYDTVQALEHKISSLEGELLGYKSISDNSTNKINPIIKNSADYVKVLGTQDRIQSTSALITNIPDLHLPSNRLECLWYDYGSLCFFKYEGETLVSTYSKTGNLNKLGDLVNVTPIDFAGHSYNIRRTVVYDPYIVAAPCVIINDYTGTYLEDNIIPRRALNSVSIVDQARIYNNLRNAVKITALKAIALIENPNQRKAVEQTLKNFIDNGSPVATIVMGTLGENIKLFNLDTKLDIEAYMRAIEAFERNRTMFNGIPTREAIEKKERAIQAEYNNQDALRQVYLEDRRMNRQIGIELGVKHRIFSSGTCEINPLIAPQLCSENEDKDGEDDGE